MKRIAYLSILAGLFLTSCVEGDYGVKPADPQTNEQEEAVTFPSSLSVSAVSAIDLAAVQADSVAIAAYTPVETAVGEVGNFRIVVDETYVLPVGAEMKVPVDYLQHMVIESYGRRPIARTFKGILEADVMVGGQSSYVASSSFDIVLTPKAPFISSAYYLIGNMNGWSTDAALNYKFNHSDKDVYEDPIFTVTFTADADCYWKILPQSNYDAGNPWRDNHVEGVLGTAVDGDTSLEGSLVTAAPMAGKIAEAGMYMMTINMMDYTYSIKALAPEYYLVGDDFAWNVNDKKFLMYAESASVQSYTGYFKGNLKFINSNDMGTDNWAACYGTAKDGSTDEAGSLVQNAGAIHAPAEGYYTFTADLKGMTYRWTKIDEPTVKYNSMAAVGGFQGWNPANPDTQMTQIVPHNWCIKDLNITTDEFKIAANGEWTDSWGELNMADNNYGTLASGANCKVVPGVYDVYFNDITKQCTIIAK